MPSPEIGLLLELVLDLKKDITSLKEESSANRVTLESNRITLEDHAARSTASEERHKVTEARLMALEKRDWMINGFFKIAMSLLGLTATILGIIAAIRNL